MRSVLEGRHGVNGEGEEGNDDKVEGEKSRKQKEKEKRG